MPSQVNSHHTQPSHPGTVTGLTFFGAIPEEAERKAKVYLGLAEAVS